MSSASCTRQYSAALMDLSRRGLCGVRNEKFRWRCRLRAEARCHHEADGKPCKTRVPSVAAQIDRLWSASWIRIRMKPCQQFHFIIDGCSSKSFHARGMSAERRKENVTLAPQGDKEHALLSPNGAARKTSTTEPPTLLTDLRRGEGSYAELLRKHHLGSRTARRYAGRDLLGGTRGKRVRASKS